MKIAILLLNNNGDILYATPVAKQIKELDYPGCTLTWIVSKQCSSVLKNNPYVDEIEAVEIKSIDAFYAHKWEEIKSLYEEKLKAGVYNKLFILQPVRTNLMRYKSSIRRMILDAYPSKIRVPVQPLLYLTDEEKSNVAKFVNENKIQAFKNRILFEFSPKSGQAAVTPDEAVRLAGEIVNNNPSTCVILSSNLELKLENPNVFNAKTLSFRENAGLLNYCSLLVGCSSGISWLSTSNACHTIPTIQFLTTQAPWFNSLKADFALNNMDSGHVVELYEYDKQALLDCINTCVRSGIAACKKKFDQKLERRYLLNNIKAVAQELYKYSPPEDYIVFFLSRMHTGVLLNGFYFGLLRLSVKKYAKWKR